MALSGPNHTPGLIVMPLLDADHCLVALPTDAFPAVPAYLDPNSRPLDKCLFHSDFSSPPSVLKALFCPESQASLAFHPSTFVVFVVVVVRVEWQLSTGNRRDYFQEA